jgi:predicted nucleic acid-binding protein
MKRYVLDACALLALLRDEPGQEFVTDVFNEADNGEAELIMHKANLLEVYYERLRVSGKPKADVFLTTFKNRPVTIISDISDAIFEEAGRLKSTYHVSFADTFALATASVFEAALLTADHHELDLLDKAGEVEFLWFR